MLKVLIADQRPDFVKAMCEQLASKYEVKACNDGKKVLDLCRRFEPDLLILDLELPGMDGLSIIRAIRNCGINSEILAITACTDSAYALRQLIQFGVQYFLPKPCTVAAAIAHVYEMILMHEGNKWSVEEEVNSLLLSLGVRMNLHGYACTHEAILMMLQDGSKQITKVIYPEIAKKFGGSSKRIERVIRSAIIDAWKRRDESVWRMYFKPDRNDEIECPSNGYFISRLSMCIERRKIS